MDTFDKVSFCISIIVSTLMVIGFIVTKAKNLSLQMEVEEYKLMVYAKNMMLDTYRQVSLIQPSQFPQLRKFSDKTESLISLAVNQSETEEGRSAAIQAIKRIAKEREQC